MKSLSNHAVTLSKALFLIYHVNVLDETYSYLDIASGIRATTFRMPSRPSLCELSGVEALPPALTGELAASWSRFAATWAALEAFNEYWARGHIPQPISVDTPPAKQSSQRRHAAPSMKAPDSARHFENLCARLSHDYDERVPEQYEECLATFKDLLKICDITPAELPAYIGLPGEALYLVSKSRHTLAAWDALDLELDENAEEKERPDKEQEDFAKHPHVLLIDAATRLVLLTIQMMAICIFPSGTQVETAGLGELMDEDEISLIDAMTYLHLENFEDHVAANASD